MLKNYLKIAFRSLWKNKIFSGINVISLAIGFSASFVIAAIIYYDFSFDKFHPDGERIYRITTAFQSPEGNYYNPGVAVPLGKSLQENKLAEIETVAPVFTTYPLHVKNETTEKIYTNPDYVVYTDAGYFETFGYQWLAGNAFDILSEPNEIVLTENRAKKYFPGIVNDDIIGSNLVYNDTIPVKVTGIVANFKERTDLVFEEFISIKTADKADMTGAVADANWNNTNSASQLFVKLTNTKNLKQVNDELKTLSISHADKDQMARGNKRVFYMQPLNKLHFDQDYYTFDFQTARASKRILINLGFVALFLLLLGCANFINLNTAQAVKRAKEIGIRKTLGSSKRQLILQFLGETLLLAIAAALVSIFLSKGLLYWFSDFIPNEVGFELFSSSFMIVTISGLLLVVTIISGFYPAFVLSKYKPVKVLKNNTITEDGKSNIRKYLTVFQFVISQILVIATLLVGKQLNYVMNEDMGFKTDAIAYFRTPWHDDSIDKKQRFIKEIEFLPEFSDLTLGGNPPASFSTHSSDVTYKDGEKEIFTNVQLLYGDEGYFDLYQLDLLAGRLPLNDSIKEYVINTTLLKTLGFTSPNEGIGKMILWNEESIPIVGVMEDFNQRSLKSGIKPMAFVGDWERESRSQFNTIHIKLSTKDVTLWSDSIAKIENIWTEIYPTSEFRFKFMDDTIKSFYQQERKTATLLNWATGLSVLISCLGLLGLVINSTERRIKEIGIRKVLGASLSQLSILLCKEFLFLVGIAFVVAVPIAWFGLHYWLEEFAYKTSLSWGVFFISGVAMIGLTILITSFRTIVAANANPIKALKNE